MRENRILTAGPYVDEKEVEYVMDAVKNGWNNEWNKYLTKFEGAIAEYVGRKYAMATSSCTGAMHLAAAALDIGPGDEVILPDLTWVATASAGVHYLGATPVFTDVDPMSWTMDPKSLEQKINSKTKAIMPVQLYGYPAEMDKIMDIADSNGLYVIEDAAPSIGAEYGGKRTGSFGDFSAFSFQGAKILTTGEGGMLLTDDEALFNKAKKLNSHGRGNRPEGLGKVAGDTFYIDTIGFKYSMSNMQAAFGLAQLEKIDFMVERKREIFNWYMEGLDGSLGIELNPEQSDKGAKSIYWMTSVLLNESSPVSRDDMMSKLSDEYNIDSRPVFPQMSNLPIHRGSYDSSENPVSKRIAENAINLPSGVNLKREDVGYVCDSIKSILKTKGDS